MVNIQIYTIHIANLRSDPDFGMKVQIKNEFYEFWNL